MIEIIPAVLPETFADIETAAAQVVGLVKTMQIDVADGAFVNNKTWPYNNKNKEKLDAILNEEEGLPQWEKLNFEIDAMVLNPAAKFETFVRLGATRVVLHIESCTTEEWKTFFEALDSYVKEQIEIGMAINVGTNAKLLEPFISEIRFVQCMGIEHVGFQQQPFDERVLEQIRKVRALTPELPISVDGGVSIETAPKLIQAGATRLVVGSALFQSGDIRGTLEAFKHVCAITSNRATTQPAN